MPAYILALILLAPNIVFAQSEIPFNTPRNSIEYKASGNTYTWQPVPESTPKPQQPYRADLSSGTASTVEPRAKWTPELPYEHKGGSGAKMTFTATASKAALAGAAAKEFGKAALTCGVKPGHPIVVSAQIGGCMGGLMLLDAAIEWGWHKLTVDDDGNVSVAISDPDTTFSDGKEYSYVNNFSPLYHSASSACEGYRSYQGSNFISSSIKNGKCVLEVDPDKNNGVPMTHTYNLFSRESGSCPAGSAVNSRGVCFTDPNDVFVTESLQAVVDRSFATMPWGHAQAMAMAGVMMAGHNVFTDGTSTTITGPSTVPMGTSSESWPVNVIPGTTTVAPAGHTGSTDPGTQTNTTTKTANNTYSGNKQTTTTSSTTNTTVTNNITNNTSSSVTTNTTQSDDAPKEKEEKTDFCKQNPDSLACAEMDSPEGEIPRDTIEIDFEPEDLGLGNGSCPADKPIDDLTVFSYQPTCDVLDTYVYPMTIVFAMFGALLIIFVGKADA